MNRGRCDGILLAAGAGTRYGMPKVLAEDGAWLRGAVHALHAGGCERVYVVLGATGPPHRTHDDSPLPRWQVSQTHGILIPAVARPVWAGDWATGMSASLRAGLAAVVAHPISPRVRPRRGGGHADSTVALSRPPSGHVDGTPAGTGSARGEADIAAAGGETGLGRPEAAGFRPLDASASRAAEADACPAAPTGTSGTPESGATAAAFGGPPEFVAIMPVDTPDVGPEVVSRVITAARGAESGLARAVFDGRPGHPVVIGRGHWAGVTVASTGKTGAASYLRERADMVCVTCGDVATGWDHDHPRHGHTPSGSK
nr:NTP transferase domain-containing protein [Nocardia sp. CC227C]